MARGAKYGNKNAAGKHKSFFAHLMDSRMTHSQATGAAQQLLALQKKHGGDMSKAVAEYNRRKR